MYANIIADLGYRVSNRWVCPGHRFIPSRIALLIFMQRRGYGLSLSFRYYRRSAMNGYKKQEDKLTDMIPSSAKNDWEFADIIDNISDYRFCRKLNLVSSYDKISENIQAEF